jgi:hypothetical protein
MKKIKEYVYKNSLIEIYEYDHVLGGVGHQGRIDGACIGDTTTWKRLTTCVRKTNAKVDQLETMYDKLEAQRIKDGSWIVYKDHVLCPMKFANTPIEHYMIIKDRKVLGFTDKLESPADINTAKRMVDSLEAA